MQPISSPTNLTGPLGTPTTVAPVAEVIAVPERDTVSQVMTAPARLEAVVASLTTVTNSEHVETLVKEPPSEQVIEKMCFHQTLHRYVTTSPNVTSVVRSLGRRDHVRPRKMCMCTQSHARTRPASRSDQSRNSRARHRQKTRMLATQHRWKVTRNNRM